MDSKKVNIGEVFVTCISENTSLSDYDFVVKNSSKKKVFLCIFALKI